MCVHERAAGNEVKPASNRLLGLSADTCLNPDPLLLLLLFAQFFPPGYLICGVERGRRV